MTSRYAALSREELAALLPELLLVGQLIDRAAMPWCISAFGREGMAEVAIEEWACASPIYTRRMQRALKYAPAPGEDGDVATIIKGLQLDIGAPPQFMDFRYTIHDRWNAEFHLDHCGALLDVEPMGDDFVTSMCHDIEDPTFDATAMASNRRAQFRPLHRPPRAPADRHPHCAWTIRIDQSFPEVEPFPGLATIERTRAAQVVLDDIDLQSPGQADYSGPVVSDLDFSEFSHSALVRMADEICLQMHLLDLACKLAVRRRVDGDEAKLTEIFTKSLTGIAGVAAERIHRALNLPGGVEGAVGVLRLHPLLNPAAYVDASFAEDAVTVGRSAAHDDGAWVSFCGPGRERPLQSVVQAIDPHLDVEVTGGDAEWTARVVVRDEPAAVMDEVAVTRLSKGVTWEFEPRRSLPITPV